MAALFPEKNRQSGSAVALGPLFWRRHRFRDYFGLDIAYMATEAVTSSPQPTLVESLHKHPWPQEGGAGASRIGGLWSFELAAPPEAVHATGLGLFQLFWDVVCPHAE